MNIARRKALAGLALLLLISLGCWGLFARNQENSRATTDRLIAEPRWQEPWHYRLLKRTNTLRFFPKRLFPRAYETSVEALQRKRVAAAGLGALGTNAWSAVPMLIEAVKHKDPGIAIYAAEALALMKADESGEWSRWQSTLKGHSSAARVFYWLLTTPDEAGLSAGLTRRRFGLVGLAATGPAAVVARGRVVELLTFSKEPELRACSAIALGAMGSEGDTAHLLQGRLTDQEEWPSVSVAAARALEAACPEDAETRRLFRQALQDRRSLVRVAAARALWRLKAPADEVLPVLMALLQHKLASVRSGALDGLSEMGGAARPARALMEPLASDENEAVRRSARAALDSCESQP